MPAVALRATHECPGFWPGRGLLSLVSFPPFYRDGSIAAVVIHDPGVDLGMLTRREARQRPRTGTTEDSSVVACATFRVRVVKDSLTTESSSSSTMLAQRRNCTPRGERTR